MEHYIDYINTREEAEMAGIIEAKIEILYDLGILKEKFDHRECQVRELLQQCKTKYQLDMLLHDVVRGNMTLNTLLSEGEKYLKVGV